MHISGYMLNIRTMSCKYTTNRLPFADNSSTGYSQHTLSLFTAMINRSVITVSLIVGVLFALLLSACNSNPTQTSSSRNTTQLAAQDSTARNTEIPLYSLTVTDAYFHSDSSKNKNIFLSYFWGTTDVTLRGWGLKKRGLFEGGPGTFDESHIDLILSVAELVPGVTIGPNTFVGTQVILKDTVNAIRKAVKNKNTILYFTPTKVSVGTSFEIIYNISYKEVKSFGNNLLIGVGATNPAPPHQAYD